MGSATNQGYASAPGDIRAFDVRTGALAWTFHTMPRPGEFGYDTWPADAWKPVGGANDWGELSVDEKRGIVYVPTSSAKYNFYGGDREGADSSRTAFSHLMPGPASVCGISRRSTTTSGTSTTIRPRS